MSAVGILTDTTASIPAALATELRIELIAYYVQRGLETLRDMIDVQPEPFARYLTQTDRLPTTSNPNIGDYLTGLKRLAERTKDIVALTMTSKGSGACQACRAAVEVLRERAPEVRVEVIDTLKVAMSQGWATIEAARAAREGQPLSAVADRAREVAHQSTMLMTADTLKYLYMGGRIGRAQHLVGSLLNIKPLIGMDDGVIVGLGAARTRAKAYSKLVEMMGQQVGAQARIKIAYTHVAAEEQVAQLRELIEQQFECVETITTWLSPALGVHSGPGTVGVHFYPVE
jgi:fatty acid kinase fatty acid binding subunit